MNTEKTINKQSVKMRLSIVIMLCVLALFLGLRIYSVNAEAELPPEESYEEGEFVEIGDNYFYQEQEKNPGYEIKVISSKFKKYEDFASEYSENKIDWDERFVRPKYVIDLEVTIRNTNKDETTGKGIDFVQMMVIASNETFQVDNELWALVRPDLAGQLGIRIRPGTEYTVHLPYTRSSAMDRDGKVEAILNKDYHLLLSLYPTKKIIQLNPEIMT